MRAAGLMWVVVLAGGCALRGGGDESRLPVLLPVREFVIPWADAFPSDVAVGADGRVWFTDRTAHVIGVFDPRTESFASFRPPTPRSAPYGLVRAPDGSLWYAASRAGRIGRIDPASGAITEHAVGGDRGPHLLAWHAGALWFTMRDERRYGRLDPVSGEVQQWELASVHPYSITSLGGSVWLSGYGSYRLARIDATTGAAEIHDVGAVLDSARASSSGERRWYWGEIRRIAGGEGSVWFTDFARGRVVRYDVRAREVTFFPSLGERVHPYGIAVASDGLVWYTEWGSGEVVVLDPVVEERSRAPLLTKNAYVRNIALDERRRRVWLPLSDRGVLALIEYRVR